MIKTGLYIHFCRPDRLPGRRERFANGAVRNLLSGTKEQSCDTRCMWWNLRKEFLLKI